MPITPQQLEALLPRAADWVAQLEAVVLRDGEALNEEELTFARKIGINFPEKIRLMKVASMPQPTDPTLAWAANETGLLGPNIAGVTFRYAIFVRSDYWRELRLVIHEMAHTHQYERFGGILPFLKQYISECLTVGYHNSPLELEARAIQERFAGGYL
jgi:hypothetical protein